MFDTYLESGSASVGTLLAYFTADALIILALVAGSALLALWLGKSNTIALILSTYPALVFSGAFPFMESVANLIALPGEGARVAVFLFALAISYFAIRQFVTGFYAGGRAMRYLEAATLGALLVGVLLSTAMVSFNLADTIAFSPLLGVIFGTGSYYFWWLLAPLPALFLAEKL